jgi:hypothetical protein
MRKLRRGRGFQAGSRVQLIGGFGIFEDRLKRPWLPSGEGAYARALHMVLNELRGIGTGLLRFQSPVLGRDPQRAERGLQEPVELDADARRMR